MAAVARGNNELDLLLSDLSKARYVGGGGGGGIPTTTTTTTTERREENYSKQSSVVEEVTDGYPDHLHHHHPVAMHHRSNGHHQAEKQAVIKELESITTEEETIIEESKEYRLNFNPDWDSGRRRRTKSRSSSPPKPAAPANHRSNLTVTTAYTTVSAVDELDSLVTCNMDSSHKMRGGVPVEIPIDMTVPITVVDLHEPFPKPGIKEAQSHTNYKRIHVDETAQAEQEEVTWVMEEVPDPPKRPEPICAACTRPISGRCITAMMRKFHPEHFVCSYCLRQLNKGTFKEREDKPYCQECFYRLFG